jgi:hypothetical protein
MHTIWRADHAGRDAAAPKSALYSNFGVLEVVLEDFMEVA